MEGSVEARARRVGEETVKAVRASVMRRPPGVGGGGLGGTGLGPGGLGGTGLGPGGNGGSPGGLRGPLDGGGDVPDQRLEVGAVHGRLAEALTGTVAVRVVPSAAHLDQLAGAAPGGERVPAELAGGESGVVEELVEAVGVEGHPGRGGPLVRGFQ